MGQQISECYRKRNIPFRKVTNTQEPNKLRVPKILVLSSAWIFAPQQEEKVVILRQWML